MKPVHCSWVDMQKLRAALSVGERGDQKALTEMRCVDKTTVSRWQAVCDLLTAIDGKVALTQLTTFQPTHAVELARHLRRTEGKKPEAWDADTAAEWVDKCEAEELTVEQFRLALRQQTASPDPTAPEPEPSAPEHPFAALMSAVTSLTSNLTRAVNAGDEDGKKLKHVLTTCALLDYPAELGGKPRFLALAGVHALLDLAGCVGRLPTDEKIKLAYAKANGTWLPPAVVLRREARRARR